jgi:hypothetical protein
VAAGGGVKKGMEGRRGTGAKLVRSGTVVRYRMSQSMSQREAIFVKNTVCCIFLGGKLSGVGPKRVSAMVMKLGCVSWLFVM